MEPDAPERDDFHASVGRKIGDFCLGFFGAYLALAVIQLPIAFLIGAWEVPDQAWLALPAVMLIVAIAAIVHFFRHGRRYIAIGIIVSVALPLLAVGACFAILAVAFSQGGFF